MSLERHELVTGLSIPDLQFVVGNPGHAFPIRAKNCAVTSTAKRQPFFAALGVPDFHHGTDICDNASSIWAKRENSTGIPITSAGNSLNTKDLCAGLCVPDPH